LFSVCYHSRTFNTKLTGHREAFQLSELKVSSSQVHRPQEHQVRDLLYTEDLLFLSFQLQSYICKTLLMIFPFLNHRLMPLMIRTEEQHYSSLPPDCINILTSSFQVQQCHTHRVHHSLPSVFRTQKKVTVNYYSFLPLLLINNGETTVWNNNGRLLWGNRIQVLIHSGIRNNACIMFTKLLQCITSKQAQCSTR